MTEKTQELSDFITELDVAVEEHMKWTRRVLRFAVLRTSPGEDVLSPLAHTLCRFGRWLTSKQVNFEKLNRQKAKHLVAVHQSMHDAIRSICQDILNDRPGQSEHIDIFEQTQTELIRLLADFKTQIIATATQYDELTKLPLRHGIEEDFVHLQKLCRRNNLLFYVALIDVDMFKGINDTFGHSVGDIVLCHLVNTLKKNIRPDEPLYRYGGDEFLLLMQVKCREAAAAAAERLINVIRSTPVVVMQNKSLPLSISMGMTLVRNGEALNEAIDRADQELLKVKRTGRDSFIIGSD
jgi:diguanylate cyclase (GGDEF)-like protein